MKCCLSIIMFNNKTVCSNSGHFESDIIENKKETLWILNFQQPPVLYLGDLK